MHTVEFIPANWLERAAAWPGLVVYSRPIEIERRTIVRRQCDQVADQLRSLISAKA